jgi:hypothetical protein
MLSPLSEGNRGHILSAIQPVAIFYLDIVSLECLWGMYKGTMEAIPIIPHRMLYGAMVTSENKQQSGTIQQKEGHVKLR